MFQKALKGSGLARGCVWRFLHRFECPGYKESTGGEDADGALLRFEEREKRQDAPQSFWGGLKGYIKAELPWIKPLLCFAVICDIA